MIPLIQILPIQIHHLFLLLSVLLIFSYFILWRDISNTFTQKRKDHKPAIILPSAETLSIIIPFRNEANRILPLLNSILEIQSSINLEFLFVDDHSIDETSNIIRNHPSFQKFNCKLLQLTVNETGKKSAIIIGVESATYPTILTTDADCQFQEKTIDTLMQEYLQNEANFCIGPVFFKTTNSNPLQCYQKIENTCLVALGLYQFKSGKPTMANGANLMFNKEIFLKLNPFKSNQNIAGGDDIFALEAFYNFNASKVISVSNPESAIYTNVVESMNDFWQQRVRWIRKTMSQKTTNTAKSQILLALFFLIFWGITLISLFQQHYEITAILWLGKLFSDVFCILQIFKTFNQKANFSEIFYASIFQNLFIPTLGVFSVFQKKVYWKNRTY